MKSTAKVNSEKRVLVGIDLGEWVEGGRLGNFSKEEAVGVEKIGYKSIEMVVPKEVASREWVSEASKQEEVRRKNPYKVNHRVMGLDGEVKGTGAGSEKGKRKSGRFGRNRETRHDGGMVVGWGTRLVPNRYDYYLEGHWMNRGSKTMAKLSRESKEGNR